jgi:hypothetical protein
MTIDDQGSRGAGWYPDPMEQHESRYWDGATWTDHVATQGVSSASSVGVDAPDVSATAAPSTHPPAGRAKSRAVLILIGGGLMAVGALLPWETVTASGTTIKSANGTSVGSGVTEMIAGGVIALLAFLFLNGTLTRKASIATLILSIIGLVLTGGNASSISDDVDKAKQAGAGLVDANVGIGLIMAIVGCLLAAVASVLLLRQKDVAATQ